MPGAPLLRLPPDLPDPWPEWHEISLRHRGTGDLCTAYGRCDYDGHKYIKLAGKYPGGLPDIWDAPEGEVLWDFEKA